MCRQTGADGVAVVTPSLPRLLLEDRLALLRGLVIMAWCLLLGMGGVEFALRMDPAVAWPTAAGFSVTYNALLAVFGVNTLVLTALLAYRNWFERVPRDAEYRVSWLLALVLGWLGLHIFFLFHASGGLDGPLSALPAVLLAAALIVLPGRAGWALAAWIAVGHGLAVTLADAALIHPQGALSAALASSGWLADLIRLAVVALAVSMALWARRWMYPVAAPHHPARRVDPDTGLFRAAFLRDRLQRELRRAHRQGSAATLLLMDFRESRDASSEAERERAYAAFLLRSIRIGSDTPARYAPGLIAVLLPAADAEAADAFCGRLVARCSDDGLMVPRIGGAVAEGGAVDSAGLIDRVESALLEAPAGGAPRLVRA